ncbi:hypothetical protein GGU11DRAFT_782558 [Lentinula aff. detonsa]|nr:hypothetical protein GGU11DRAFT_782558 [Lentinula aff. detonsa]
MQKVYRILILILALAMTTQAAPLDGRGRALDQHEHSSRAPNSNSLGSRQPSHMPLEISTTSVLVSRAPGVTLTSLLDNGAIKPFDAVLIDSDKKVFDPEINDIKFGKEITGLGRNNDGIWEVIEFRGQPRNDLIAKFFLEAESRDYGEVKALKMMNLLVESGKTLDPHPERESSLLPVIVMKKKEGITCRQYIKDRARKRGPLSSRGPLLQWNQRKKSICEQVAEDALKFLVFHDDNNVDNVLVTVDGESLKVELVGYGGAYMVIDKSIPKETIYKACIGE